MFCINFKGNLEKPLGFQNYSDFCHWISGIKLSPTKIQANFEAHWRFKIRIQNYEEYHRSKFVFWGFREENSCESDFEKKSHFKEILEVSAQCCPSKYRFSSKKWKKKRGFVFCKNRQFWTHKWKFWIFTMDFILTWDIKICAWRRNFLHDRKDKVL